MHPIYIQNIMTPPADANFTLFQELRGLGLLIWPFVY